MVNHVCWHTELIDTLWNVNIVTPAGISASAVCELIDTLWNVNFVVIYSIYVSFVN